ncbi:hypothetical protein [Streptomyces sp. NPDC047868]|uniref:hypothetical protein n=1 Tax=Streptomyces sp. NPDC047868 TaxID=3155480 RepID=UPI003453CF9E
MPSTGVCLRASMSSIGCPYRQPAGRRRVDAVVQEAALDAVRVRVPALTEQQLQLTLGHLRALGELQRTQTTPQPPSRWEPGQLLGVQRLADRAAAVAERHSAYVVPPRVTPLNLRDTQHRPSTHRL